MLYIVAENLKKLVANLSKRGPHRVLIGDLSFVGLPGKVYAPAGGKNIAGVAFGHDWRSPIGDYHATLRHLASWGIAVAAPDTERGFKVDHRGLANDLESCLQILGGVRLGEGDVIVNPNRLGLAGHGMGAGAAVLAAAGRPNIQGVGCVFPADTAPPATAAATNVSAPGLVLAPGEDQWAMRGNPYKLALQWEGDVVLREVDDAYENSFSETPLLRRALGFSRSKTKHQEVARAALTGFLLAAVAKDDKYDAFLEQDADIKGCTNRDREYWQSRMPQNFSVNDLKD